MKSIIIRSFGGPEVLEYSERETPPVGDNQVLIDVRGTSVNNADIQVRSGNYHLATSFPFTPGLDAAGVVARIGGNVTTIAPGDRVIAFPVSGSYAQQIVAEEALTFVIPATIDYSDPDYAVTVNRATEGRGVDVILNSLGGHTLERDSTCLAPFGRLICFGKLSGTAGFISPESLYPTNRSVIGFSFGHYRKLNPDAIQKTMRQVITMVEDRALTMEIDSCFPLKDAPLAHQRLESRKAIGKILLYPVHSE